MSYFERDSIIFNACEELDKLVKYVDADKIDVFRKSIKSPPADNVFPEIKWDSDYVENSIQQVKQRVVTYITNDILKNIQVKKINDSLFVGGSYSIALRLCIRYFFRYQNIEDINDLPRWFLSDCKYFNMDFFYFVRVVEEEYEKRYMRYRLWDDKSISELGNYIFLSYEDYDQFESPPILEYCDPSDVALAKEDFVEVLSEIILNYPLHNFCEIRFPPYSEYGYIFAEFLPVKDMPIRHIDALYETYIRCFCMPQNSSVMSNRVEQIL